jgi:Flp pilus assembly pilin Flp
VSPEPVISATSWLPVTRSGGTRRRTLAIVKRVASDEGQTLVEYGLIIGFVAIVIVASLSQIAPVLSDVFNAVAAAIEAAIG